MIDTDFSNDLQLLQNFRKCNLTSRSYLFPNKTKHFFKKIIILMEKQSNPGLVAHAGILGGITGT